VLRRADGVSNMLGSIFGVATQLQKLYPNIIIWHCCNYHLELFVSDTLKEIQGTPLPIIFRKVICNISPIT